MMDEVGDFLWRLFESVLALVIVAVFFGAIAGTGLAPEPGDPYYIAWLDVTRYGWKALVWVIPGVGTAAYLVFKFVADTSDF